MAFDFGRSYMLDSGSEEQKKSGLTINELMLAINIFLALNEQRTSRLLTLRRRMALALGMDAGRASPWLICVRL